MGDNLNSFETRIRRYLRENDASTSFWSQNFIRQLFNANYRRRCSQMIMAYEGFFTLIATRDLTASKSTYGFPSGMLRVLKLELVRTDGRTVPLQRYERHDQINPADDSTVAGDQYYPTFRPISDGFVLEPTPIETVTDGIRLEYAGVPPMLSGGGDALHPTFPEILDELLVLDTVVSAFEAERVHEMGPLAAIRSLRAEYASEFERFIENRIISRDEVEPFIAHYQDY